jgi:hypothetical protein
LLNILISEVHNRAKSHGGIGLTDCVQLGQPLSIAVHVAYMAYCLTEIQCSLVETVMTAIVSHKHAMLAISELVRAAFVCVKMCSRCASWLPQSVFGCSLTGWTAAADQLDFSVSCVQRISSVLTRNADARCDNTMMQENCIRMEPNSEVKHFRYNFWRDIGDKYYVLGVSCSRNLQTILIIHVLIVLCYRWESNPELWDFRLSRQRVWKWYRLLGCGNL